MSISGVPDEFEELMPCSACPDGYVWDSNGPTCKPCPVCKGHAAVGYRAAQTEQTSGGTQQRPEQASASKPESRPGPLDHQSATGTNCAAEDGARPSPESARGPAADPITDLCAELRATHCSNENLHDNAAYELERLERTERLLQAGVRHETARAERAEAERDALRECIDAADARRKIVSRSNEHLWGAYDAARAKVKP